MNIFKKKPAKAQLKENFYLEPEHFSPQELKCADGYKNQLSKHYKSIGITTNHLSFDLLHYYRVKQFRGLIKTK